MFEIGLSIGALQSFYGDKDSLRIAKEIKADAIDFSLEDFNGRYDYRNPNSIYAKSEEEFCAYFLGLKEYANSLGLKIAQTHGRGFGFRDIKEEDEALIRNARLDCWATSLLGAPVCVIHAVTTMFHMDKSAQYMRNLNFQMFTNILPYAKKYGIKIATETFGDVHGGVCCDFFGNLDEFIDSYEKICSIGDNRKYFTVCMDTGHTNKATKFNGNPQVHEAIRILGDRITVLHLNDNNTEGDQHLIPFVDKSGQQISGTIDWGKTFDALKEIGYSGVYNMELHLQRYGEELIAETGAFAIKVLRNALKKRENDKNL